LNQRYSNHVNKTMDCTASVQMYYSAFTMV
jgi:hypothetical protein